MQVDDLFEVSNTEGDGDDAGPAMVLRVHVQPGAGRSAVVGRHGTALKVRVAAPPVGGRANEACAEVLAATLGLKPAQVELVGGQTSRSKTFRITGLDAGDLTRRLEQAVGGGPAGTGPDPSPTGRR